MRAEKQVQTAAAFAPAFQATVAGGWAGVTQPYSTLDEYESRNVGRDGGTRD